MTAWKRVNLRRLAKLGTGHTPSRQKDEYWVDCKIPWLTLADVWQLRGDTRTTVMETAGKISQLGLENSAAVVHPAGTVVMSRTASVGFSGILGIDMATSQDYVTWTCGPDLRPRYLLYALRGLRDEILGARMGSTHQTIYMPDVERISIPLPASLEDQDRIADFLDCETARIDTLLAKKRRLVALLEEKVECLVRRRIAESGLADGLTGSAVATIRKVLMKLDRSPISGNMVTAYRDGQVTARSLRRAEGYTESWTENSSLQGVRKGDVVVHGLDGFAGAIGTSEADGVCSPVYHVCAPVEDGNAVYLGRMLHVLAIDGYLGLFSSSTRERAVDFRNWDLFGRIPIPKVPAVEQRTVAEMIKKIGPLKVAVERSTDLARERKQALITATVTGEMEVPGVS